jgi:hypothetical protein
MILWRTRKVDGSRFFWSIFNKMGRKLIYTDLWKNSPHKKHCAWAPTPTLAKSIKFIENYGFFGFLGLHYSRENRHQSRHLRPTPPREEPKSGKFSKK